MAEDWLRQPRAHFQDESLSGSDVVQTVRRISDLAGHFQDQERWAAIDPETIVYTVRAHLPVENGTEGGLFFGVSRLEAGVVGDEYYMTKGHFHELPSRGEYYWGIKGSGYLLLYNETESWVERVQAGSLHYVPGYTAHRLVNVGETRLSVGACWPADAGHDYGTIADRGFPILVLKGARGPRIVESPSYAK